MKKNLLVLGLLLGTLTAWAQSTGKVVENNVVASKILGKNVSYALYLPPDYDASARTYPVVYLLHGYTDDHTGWLQFGEVNRYADRAIAAGEIPPMIIVMPDGGVSWYINSYDGKERYEDFFVQEFMPAIEKQYRIKADRAFRGVAGLSMGGYGSLILAMKHPDLFAACAPLSAAVFTDAEAVASPEANYERTFGQLYGRGLKGKDRLTETWYKNSILKIIETANPDELNKVRYWIDCGDDDFLYRGNDALHTALSDRKIPHEYRVRDGGHTWTYWRTGITDALKFIGVSFRR